MNRTHRSVLAAMLAVVFLMFLVLSATGLSVARVSADTRSLVLQASESPCVAVVDKWAVPDNVLLGETVDVTITVRPECPAGESALHIVLVLDGSGSMAGSPSQQMKQETAGLIRELDMVRNPSTKVGVVEFNSSARTLSYLSNDERSVVGAINRVGANGSSSIDAGIEEGVRVFRRGRGSETDIIEVMIVLSDGGNNAGCNPVLQAARQARGQGILLMAICLGPGCDEQCMRQVASNPRVYFRADSARALQGVLQEIRVQYLQASLERLVVHEIISSTLQFVPGSVKPPQSAPGVPIDWLEWEQLYVSRDGVTFTCTVKPLEVGALPIGAATRGRLTDIKGRTRTFSFPVPWITVLRPGVLPTPDKTTTPTQSATPTSTPTATVTPTPTVSPTPRPRPLYLPCLLDKRVW